MIRKEKQFKQKKVLHVIYNKTKNVLKSPQKNKTIKL